MPISTAQIQAKVIEGRDAQTAVIDAAGSDCAFKLHTGETFTIKGVLKHMTEDEMTDGINQDRRRLTVAATKWAAVAPAGREPEKGDQVTVMGRRHAIMEADPVVMSGITMVWRIRLLG